MKAFARRINSLYSKIGKSIRQSSAEDMIIGEVLIQKNIISKEQLQTALSTQKEKLIQEGKVIRLGLIIVELGYSTEEEIVRAINEHYQISVSSLADNIKERVKKLRGTFIERLPAPRFPLWLQMSATTLLVIVLTVVVLNLVILKQQRKQLYQQTVRIGVMSLNYFGNNARLSLFEDNVSGFNDLITDAAAMEEILYAFVVDHTRKIRVHTDLNKIGKTFETFTNIEEVTRKADVTYFNYTLPSGQQVLNLTQPVMLKGKKLGDVHVGFSIDFIERLLLKEKIFIMLITVFIIFWGLVISVLLGIRYSRPISKLAMATQEICNGNYHCKVELERNDELGNLAAAFNHMSEEIWKQSLLKESLSKYVGVEVIEMIMDNPQCTWLKGHRNEATILFADIRGFTSFSDEKEPEMVVERLNEYFEITSKAIIKYGGYIDKFIGDAVMGVFGVPVYHKNHMERAVRAAIDLQQELKDAEMNNRLLASIGIGIDSGIVVSGNIGSHSKMEYTVIGDSVNVASRLNGLAGPGEIVISKAVYKQVSDIISVESLPPQQIKGKAEPVETYKILDIKAK